MSMYQRGAVAAIHPWRRVRIGEVLAGGGGGVGAHEQETAEGFGGGVGGRYAVVEEPGHTEAHEAVTYFLKARSSESALSKMPIWCT